MCSTPFSDSDEWSNDTLVNGDDVEVFTPRRIVYKWVDLIPEEGERYEWIPGLGSGCPPRRRRGTVLLEEVGGEWWLDGWVIVQPGDYMAPTTNAVTNNTDNDSCDGFKGSPLVREFDDFVVDWSGLEILVCPCSNRRCCVM